MSKFIQKIKCFFGFHSWSNWRYGDIGDNKKVRVHIRWCNHCREADFDLGTGEGVSE